MVLIERMPPRRPEGNLDLVDLKRAEIAEKTRQLHPNALVWSGIFYSCLDISPEDVAEQVFKSALETEKKEIKHQLKRVKDNYNILGVPSETADTLLGADYDFSSVDAFIDSAKKVINGEVSIKIDDFGITFPYACKQMRVTRNFGKNLSLILQIAKLKQESLSP